MKDKILMTKEGLEKLKKEYEELKKRRPKAVERLQKARAMGDLSENSEYTAARQELSFIDGRILELEAIISRAEIVEEKVSDRVQMGDTIELESEGKRMRIVLVGEFEADPVKSKFSINSPLGKALVGRKKGEEVEVETPAGKRVYRILRITKI